MDKQSLYAWIHGFRDFCAETHGCARGDDFCPLEDAPKCREAIDALCEVVKKSDLPEK